MTCKMESNLYYIYIYYLLAPKCKLQLKYNFVYEIVHTKEE